MNRKGTLLVLGFAMFLLILAGTARLTVLAESPPMIRLPEGTVDTAYELQDPEGDAYFHISLNGVGTGYDVVDRVEYLGWCIDPHAIDEYPSSGRLYSSYAADLPEDIRSYKKNLIPWDKVNWILNHKQDYSNRAINAAIWFLVTGERDHDENEVNSCRKGSACDDLAAQANANGSGFVPQPGQAAAVILRANGISHEDDGLQDAIIEVKVPEQPQGLTPTPTDSATPTPTTTPTVPASPEPKIDIRKQAEGADSRTVGFGSEVPFEIVVTNSGNVLLEDIQVSDELAPGCAQTIGDLSPGESRTLSCSVPSVTQSFTNTACVSGHYKDTAVQDCDPSSVNPAYQVFIPVSWRPYAYNLTVGYEDLELNHPGLDYDYNDFNTAIHSLFITDPENQDLQRIVFTFTPRARGGQYSHALHMLFPANVFPSDGTATLTLKDQSGRPLSSVQQPFIAAQANDYIVLPCTCDAFPGEKGIVNALEGTPYQNTQQIAELSIAFNTPFPLNLDIVDENRIEIAHGAGLFFDPYLHVFNTNDDIHQGDPRIISAPSDFWRWPEEGVRLDRAYPMVTGTPPDQSFPSEWWINHNNCIYGDGVVCPE